MRTEIHLTDENQKDEAPKYLYIRGTKVTEDGKSFYIFATPHEHPMGYTAIEYMRSDLSVMPGDIYATIAGSLFSMTFMLGEKMASAGVTAGDAAELVALIKDIKKAVDWLESQPIEEN